MKTTSHLLVLFFVAFVHITLYLIIVNAHEESIKDAQVSLIVPAESSQNNGRLA
ncbi:hypothetical protein HA050_04280 [Iodobacter sp. HSC-16F04]|uniref:Energy transducer TonB n=1 Tax=Iodobacter violaceini TaxID=3044271 RepID=A0ABX0KP63_9NEIS|nr:hypothetical protein [Iodobacter violacea]NHQ85329.1 hypothetical protein [Iodobacter violacea]